MLSPNSSSFLHSWLMTIFSFKAKQDLRHLMLLENKTTKKSLGMGHIRVLELVV